MCSGGLKAADLPSQSAALHPRTAPRDTGRDAEHCRLSGALPKGETSTLGGQETQREVPDEFKASLASGCSWREGKERHRSSAARPDDVKEIIEASETRLGLQLAKSIIANQFFDDLCPLLFGLGMARDGTGIFLQTPCKTSVLSAGFLSCNEALKVPFPTQTRHFGFIFLHTGTFPGSLTKA